MRMPERADNNDSASIAQDEITPPPGWTGVLAQFIYNHAPYPNASIAISGALGLMSALLGRTINVSGTGPTLYIASVGGTGIGKEAAASAVSKIASHVAKTVPGVYEFIGPSSLASPEAAHKRIAKTPSVLVFIGELGIKLKIWCAPNANAANAGLVAFLLDSLGKSGRGNRLGARENSDKDKGAAAVESPNLVLLGDTTETTLLEALTEAILANGLVPRFLFLFAGERRSALNRNRQLEPQSELVSYIANTAATSLANQQQGVIFDICLDAEAQTIDDEIEALTTSIINGSQSEIKRHLYSRARLNILKVSALVAAGDWNANFEIKSTHILWARTLVFSGIERLLSKVDNGEFGEVAGNQSIQERKLIDVIRFYMSNPWPEVGKYHGTEAMHSKGIITQHYITKRLQTTACFKNDKGGAQASIIRTIKMLLDGDVLREMPPSQMTQDFGCHPRAFVVSNREIVFGKSEEWLKW